MSREEPASEPEPEREPARGVLEPTPPLSLLGWVVLGLVGGWAVRPVCERLDVVPPLVTVAQPAALVLLAAIVGYGAWATHRAVHVRRERLQPHQAVNRLVLARACAIAGALVAGGYLGYAVSWIGHPAEQADVRLVRSLVAAAAAAATTGLSLLLERACRTPADRG